MNAKYFENEVVEARRRFNQTFGTQVICNLKLRQAVILNVCWLGVLANQISIARDGEKAKPLVKHFIRINNSLNKFFDRNTP